MASIDEFKGFVRKNPRLIKYTKSGEMSWQKFYELYDLYGEDAETWKPYLENAEAKIAAASTAATGVTSIADFMGFLKNIDLDSVQNGVSSIQRVLSVVQDLAGKDDKTEKKAEYKPRPLYKHFED